MPLHLLAYEGPDDHARAGFIAARLTAWVLTETGGLISPVARYTVATEEDSASAPQRQPEEQRL